MLTPDSPKVERNPLFAPIDAHMDSLLAGQPLAGSLREGDLLLWLRAQQWVDAQLDNAALYKVHFLIRNAWYRYAREHARWCWNINPLGVEWCDRQAGNHPAQAGSAALAEYYGNWDNLDLSSRQVEALLEDFWARYARFNQASALAPALAQLGLVQLPTLAELKHCWRRKMAQLHPDKTGSAAHTAEVQALNQAYTQIKLALKARVL